MFCSSQSAAGRRTRLATASRASHPHLGAQVSIELLPAVSLAVALVGAALAAAILLHLRYNPTAHQQSLEPVLRDELARGRQESAVGAKMLREEAATSARALREEVQQTLQQLGGRLGVAVT